MKRLFLLISFITSLVVCQAQGPVRHTPNGSNYDFSGSVRYSGNLRLPTDSSKAKDTGAISYNRGDVYVNGQDGKKQQFSLVTPFDTASAKFYLSQWKNYPTPRDLTYVDYLFIPDSNVHLIVSHASTTDGIYRSLDGISWTACLTEPNELRSLAYGPPKKTVVCVGSTGATNRIFYSLDFGKTWIGVPSMLKGWRWVIWSERWQRFIVCAYTGTGQRFATSPDGINWTLRNSLEDNAWNKLIEIPETGRIIAVASTGTHKIEISDDGGVTWYNSASLLAGTYNGGTYMRNRKRLVLVASITSGGTQGAISDDYGTTWTEFTNMLPARNWLDADFSDEYGAAVAVAAYGAAEGDDSTRIGVTFDGVNWVHYKTEYPRNCRRIHWIKQFGQFFIICYTFSIDGGMNNLIVRNRPLDRDRRYLDLYGRDTVQKVYADVDYTANLFANTVSPGDSDRSVATTAFVYQQGFHNMPYKRIGYGATNGKFTSASGFEFDPATSTFTTTRAFVSYDGKYPSYDPLQAVVVHPSGNFGLGISRTGGTGGGNITFYGLRGTDPSVKTALQVNDRIGNFFYRGIPTDAVTVSNTHETNVIVSAVGSNYLASDQYERGINSSGTFGTKRVLTADGSELIGFVVGSTFPVSPHSSSVLELTSTTKGFLPPRMTAAQRLAISSPAAGLIVYDTDSSRHMMYNGSAWKGLKFTDEGGGGGGTGDVAGPSSSVDGEIALFDGTTGKLLKRAATTGLLKAASGVMSAATAGTDYVTPTGTETVTNKRVVPVSTLTTSASSLTPDFTANDIYGYTALAANLTINAPTGSPSNGETWMIYIKDNGTSRTLTWNAAYVQSGITLPSSTTTSKAQMIHGIYINSTYYATSVVEEN